MTLAPSRLGRYVLISEISRGGYGRLSTACTRLDSGEARAVLLRRLVKGPPLGVDAFDAIAHAARLSASAHGAHVATAIDVEETDEELGVAFEHAEGKDLRSVLALASLKRQRIPASVALHVALSALDGLAELRGDFPEELRTAALWPDTVFFAIDGSVKLFDAPVAAAIARSPGPRALRQLVGYSAPEELDEGAAIEQCDVFRAGVLLWEMVSGKRLFSGATLSTNIEQVLRAPIPDFEELAPEHAELAKVIARALERDRALRHPSADALRDELADCGVAPASAEEAGAYLTELLGAGLAVQQRALALALERLPENEAGEDEAEESAPVAGPLAALAGASSTTTLLGVPGPAFLPAKPARPLPLPPPPPRREPGAAPLALPPIDDLESPIASNPEPERISLESLSDAELIEEPAEEPVAALVPLPFAPPPPSSPSSPPPSLEPAASAGTSRFSRRHVIAAAALCAVLLVGGGVLALVGLGGSEASEGAASSSAPAVASHAPAAPRPKPPPPAATVAESEPPSPAPPASAEPEEPPKPETPPAPAAAAFVAPKKLTAAQRAKQKREAALAAQKKKQAAAKKKKLAQIAAAKRAQAELIAKLNKAKKKRAAEAKKKQQAAAKKKKKKPAAKPKPKKTAKR